MLPINYPVAAAKIKDLKSDFEKKSNDLARARQSVADLPRFQAEFAALHERYEMAARAAADRQARCPACCAGSPSPASSAGSSSRASAPNRRCAARTTTPRCPIELKVVGGYHQVGQFLAEIANMPRIMRVSNLEVLANTKQDSEDQTTAAMMTVTVYTLNADATGGATGATGAATKNASAGGNSHGASH